MRERSQARGRKITEVADALIEAHGLLTPDAIAERHAWPVYPLAAGAFWQGWNGADH